ncbi:hypothetical protein ACLOJK_039658 [Asimina triloba]
MGHDRSGIELNLLMTGEEDSPRVATVVSVGLRSQQIWNVRIVAVVMNGSDRGNDGPAVVGLGRSATTSSWASYVAVDGGGAPCSTVGLDGGCRRWAVAARGGDRRRRRARRWWWWQPPFHEHGGTPKVTSVPPASSTSHPIRKVASVPVAALASRPVYKATSTPATTSAS